MVRSLVFLAAALFGAIWLFPSGLKAADEELVWGFGAFNDPENKGRMTARLDLAIPETDTAQVSGVCDASPSTSVNFSNMVFATDVGTLKDGTQVELRFSGQGVDHVLSGVVSGARAEVGITGVSLDVEHDDPIWAALTQKQTLSYRVPGYKASSLKLAGGQDKIKAFIGACRSYAEAINQPIKAQLAAGGQAAQSAQAAPKPGAPAQASPPAKPDKAANQSAAASDISEKEAFESAKELGTIEAWEAFLNNFSSGFRADLARAYVRRINQTQGAAKSAPPPAPPAAAPVQPAPMPPMQTIDLGPGTTPWRNGQIELDEGNARAYAAIVNSHGIEFVARCDSSKRLAALLRQQQRDVYPDFDRRIEQGLAASSRKVGDGAKEIPLRFSSGKQYFVSAQVYGLTGEVEIADVGQPFVPQSQIIDDMMSEQTMTISAAPFSATFQLKNSRGAICAVLRRCGARLSACNRKATKKASPRRTTTRKSRCGRGRVWLEGQCVANANVRSFCGPGYQRSGSRCVSQAVQQAPAQRCPPGMIWELGGCTEDD